jgi:DNA-binding transcriptional ArsR family regulator
VRTLAVESSKIRIRLLVSLLPGLHLRELQRLIGMSFNSTRYQVDKLTASGEILRIEEGGFSRLYPIGTSDTDKALFSAIRRPTDRRILATMVRTRRVSHRELSTLTGFAKSTLSEHLGRLVEIGAIVRRISSESMVEYELTDPVRIEALINVQNLTLVRRATDRFIDLWDF